MSVVNIIDLMKGFNTVLKFKKLTNQFFRRIDLISNPSLSSLQKLFAKKFGELWTLFLKHELTIY